MLKHLKLRVAVFSAVFAWFATTPLMAAPLPYSKSTPIFRKKWDEKYPVKPVSVVANPAGRGVLAAYSARQTVYYYHFRVVIPILARKQTETEISIEPTGKTRTVEVWMRYRTRDRIYDLAFVRQDLLPGTNRRWLRVR